MEEVYSKELKEQAVSDYLNGFWKSQRSDQKIWNF